MLVHLGWTIVAWGEYLVTINTTGEGIDGISLIELTANDIVRHSLIGIIVERLEAAEHTPNSNGRNRIKQLV